MKSMMFLFQGDSADKRKKKKKVNSSFFHRMRVDGYRQTRKEEEEEEEIENERKSMYIDKPNERTHCYCRLYLLIDRYEETNEDK